MSTEYNLEECIIQNSLPEAHVKLTQVKWEFISSVTEKLQLQHRIQQELKKKLMGSCYIIQGVQPGVL